MTDRFGRQIDYLRVSVTERCNLNCLYCGSLSPRPDGMTGGEIIKAVSLFAANGIKKVRLTGGEPLVRHDILKIAEGISLLPGVEKTAITTNGVLLPRFARGLKDAGVSAVNVSLDAITPGVFAAVSGGKDPSQVLRGIESAIALGLTVHINSVLVRGVNDGEAEKLLSLPEKLPVDLRFIELMPFAGQGDYEKLRVTQGELLSRFPFLVPLPDENGVACLYTAKGYCGRVGFISPLSNKFCPQCSRVRLLSDGSIRPCLGHSESIPLLPFLSDEKKADEIIKKAIMSKPACHYFETETHTRAMNKIGG